MKKYITIVKVGNAEVGEIFVETGVSHKKWKLSMYIKEGTKIEDNNFFLENLITNKKYFKELNSQD